MRTNETLADARLTKFRKKSDRMPDSLLGHFSLEGVMIKLTYVSHGHLLIKCDQKAGEKFDY